MNYSKRYLIWAVIPRQKNPTIIENNHTQQFSTLVYLLDYLRVQSKLDFFKNGGNGSKIIWVDKKWSQVFNISYFLIVKLNFSTLGLFPSSYYPKALVIDDSQERRSFLCFLDRTFFYLGWKLHLLRFILSSLRGFPSTKKKISYQEKLTNMSIMTLYNIIAWRSINLKKKHHFWALINHRKEGLFIQNLIVQCLKITQKVSFYEKFKWDILGRFLNNVD